MKHFKKESPIKITMGNRSFNFSTRRLCEIVYCVENDVSSDIDEVTCDLCIRLYKLRLFM